MLRLEGIRAGYGAVEILHGVDLTVPAGEVVALLGPNGAGKSTLLKVAAGLLRPTTGQVALDGIAVDALPPHLRARAGVCLIPEGRGIFQTLTVRENLAMHVGGTDVDTAVELAAGCFPVLGRRLPQLAGTLSGGEQQMLAVARAIVTQPAVVLADELSSGLAPVVVDEILAAVSALRARGCALLIVEQHVERVLEMADYVVVLHKGLVAFVGEPGQCRDGAVLEGYVGAAR